MAPAGARALAAAGALLALGGCAHAPPSPRPAATAPAASAPTAPAAATTAPSTATGERPTEADDAVRSLADLTVRDWMDGDGAALYRRMSRRYREAYPVAALDGVLEQLNRAFGKVRTAELKSMEVGTATTADGAVFKLWTLWYAVATDKYPVGTHFAKVDVIAEPELAIMAFQIATFPNGVPPALR